MFAPAAGLPALHEDLHVPAGACVMDAGCGRGVLEPCESQGQGTASAKTVPSATHHSRGSCHLNLCPGHVEKQAKGEPSHISSEKQSSKTLSSTPCHLVGPCWDLHRAQRPYPGLELRWLLALLCSALPLVATPGTPRLWPCARAHTQPQAWLSHVLPGNTQCLQLGSPCAGCPQASLSPRVQRRS